MFVLALGHSVPHPRGAETIHHCLMGTFFFFLYFQCTTSGAHNSCTEASSSYSAVNGQIRPLSLINSISPSASQSLVFKFKLLSTFDLRKRMPVSQAPHPPPPPSTSPKVCWSSCGSCPARTAWCVAPWDCERLCRFVTYLTGWTMPTSEERQFWRMRQIMKRSLHKSENKHCLKGRQAQRKGTTKSLLMCSQCTSYVSRVCSLLISTNAVVI